MGRTLLLTGHPGVGKTTAIRQVAEALGSRAGGFYTQEILGPGGRKGFQLVTLDGREIVMAHVDIRTRNRVGRYGVDVAALDRVGVGAVRQAVESPTTEIVVIDEIGRMEMFSGEFRGAVLKAISSNKIVIATLMQKADDWTGALKTLPQVTVWEITESNRNALPVKIVEWIGPGPHGTST